MGVATLKADGMMKIEISDQLTGAKIVERDWNDGNGRFWNELRSKEVQSQQHKAFIGEKMEMPLPP